VNIKKKPTFVAAMVVALLLASSVPSLAVTFGQEETSSSVKFPWAVPVLHFEKDGTEPNGLCTGTLIKSDVVLTAAHCIPEDGFFKIKYGITSLEEDDKDFDVKATWIHPRYSKSRFGINDIGLLKLKEPIIGAITLPLATVKNLKLAESSKEIRILGWGEDQNGTIATYLRSAKLSNQSTFLTKLLGKKFNKNTWVAAGRYNSIERVYAGGCRGDSGGPLVAMMGSRYIQIGITSFGAENCETEVPTIFMKTSYFLSDISAAITQLNLNAVVNDRSPAENLSPPTISGEARVGSTLTCNPGSWSANIRSLSYEWSGINLGTLSDSQNLAVTASLAGVALKCTVTGSSKVNTVSVSVNTQVPEKLTIVNQARILGLPSDGSNVAASNNLSCQAGTASGVVETSTFYWLLRNSTSDTTGTTLGTTQTITLPSAFFTSNNRKDLVCVNVLNGPGGTVRAQANGTIYAPYIPTVSSVSYSGFTGYYGSNADSWIGTTLTCTGFSSLPSSSNSSLIYSWRVYEFDAPYWPTDATPSRIISNGPTLTLTEAILKDAVMKRIGCAATASTIAGSSTGYSSMFYVDFKNLNVPDLNPPTFSLISIKPYNGPAFRLRDPMNIVFTAGDISGLGTYPFSFKAVVNGSAEVPISTNGNIYAFPGGTNESTKYDWSLILPGASSGGKLGSYQVFISISDVKGNSTGWKLFTTFDVTGERTD
jgi:hypothetical protein